MTGNEVNYYLARLADTPILCGSNKFRKFLSMNHQTCDQREQLQCVPQDVKFVNYRGKNMMT
jgi:hypothetical protein